jgi:hypothetical protein
MDEPTNSLNAVERSWGSAWSRPDEDVAVSHACCLGGGGMGTAASGVGTYAASWVGFPQFVQNRLSSRNP